jgi:hypothetical protein
MSCHCHGLSRLSGLLHRAEAGSRLLEARGRHRSAAEAIEAGWLLAIAASWCLAGLRQVIAHYGRGLAGGPPTCPPPPPAPAAKEWAAPPGGCWEY